MNDSAWQRPHSLFRPHQQASYQSGSPLVPPSPQDFAGGNSGGPPFLAPCQEQLQSPLPQIPCFDPLTKNELDVEDVVFNGINDKLQNFRPHSTTPTNDVVFNEIGSDKLHLGKNDVVFNDIGSNKLHRGIENFRQHATTPNNNVVFNDIANDKLHRDFRQPLMKTDLDDDVAFNGISSNDKLHRGKDGGFQHSTPNNDVVFNDKLHRVGDFNRQHSTPNNGYMPSTIGYNNSQNVDLGTSPSPFGLLPHMDKQATVSRPGVQESASFVSPGSKPTSSFSNGDVGHSSGVSTSTNPLSNSSLDTATPSPANVNSLSSNFSSPSRDYSNFSPQTATNPPGASYAKPVHSPLPPQSPFPPSPYDTTHIANATPCSPMNMNGTYVNNYKSVPRSNGLHKPAMNSTCYAPQATASRPNEYHVDLNNHVVHAPDRISPTNYSSGYPTLHTPRINNDSTRTPISPRGNANVSLEQQMRYRSANPGFMQNADLSYPQAFDMKPPTYMPSRSYAAPSIQPSTKPGDPYDFSTSEVAEETNSLEVFNSRVNVGASTSSSSYSHYSMPPTPQGPSCAISNRQQSRPSASQYLVPSSPVVIKKEPPSYDTYEPMDYLGNTFGSNRTRERGGRRGRRRAGNTGCRGRGRGRGRQALQDEDRTVYFYHTQSRATTDYSQSRTTTNYNSQPSSSRTAEVFHQPDVPFDDMPDVQPKNVPEVSPNSRARFEHGFAGVLHELRHYVTEFRPKRLRRSLRTLNNSETRYNTSFLGFLMERATPPPGGIYPPLKEHRKRKKHQPRPLFLKPERAPSPPEPPSPPRGPPSPPGGPVKLKMKLVKGHKSSKKWWMTLNSGDRQPPVLPPSLKVKRETAEEETRVAGNKGKASANKPKPRGRGRTTNNPTNSSVTLLAGTVKSAPPTSEKEPVVPKRKGRRRKSQPTEDTAQEEEKASVNAPESSNLLKPEEATEEPDMDTKVKEEVHQDPEEGPSFAFDDDEEEGPSYSDSDEDPIWMPGDKNNKNSDGKAFLPTTGRKRGGGAKRGAKRKKKAPDSDNDETVEPVRQPRKRQCKKLASEAPKPRGRKPATGADRFLIAKEDINLPTPYLWKVDRKSSMLQRFEISEQNGVLLYHSSFTYAAGNQFCVNKYVTAEVKILSPETVQYIGPNLSETAEIALSEMGQEKPVKKGETYEHMKEDFTVYIQCLLSQDVDKSFLEEIKKFNDEYFIVPMQSMEAISEQKKSKFINEFWSEELKKSIHTFPKINVMDCGIEGLKCQACTRVQGTKLLQFFGQAYDPSTLEHLDPPSSQDSQFSVCDNCSVSVSMYSRLHHQKYQLFVQCHTKASQVRANDAVQSHEDVLKICLEDVDWINKIFADQVRIWKDCEKES